MQPAMIGLEIHQQLNTKKLFCNCPSEIGEGKPDIVVMRRLRASAGETGETDIAAEYEMKKGKHFIYNCHHRSTCAVELDEEPIHQLNPEALRAVLQAAIAVGATPVDRIQVMRKAVIDGSNTSGFQRTALVATGGTITTSPGEVRIATICVEEDSAKIERESPDYTEFNLSRLGIPLIEMATEPDIKSPEQVREAAEHIGMVLRSTGKVKRGLGTIRQDINVSIPEGARVEVKGAQDLKLLPKIAELEIRRQKMLVQIAAELQKRKAKVEEEIHDITALFHNTESAMIKEALSKGGKILAIKLRGFAGLIKTEIQPDRRLGKEFSEYARQAAGVGGAMHSDELPKQGITEKEKIAAHLKLGPQDSFLFVADEKEKARKALEAIIQRAKQAIKGIPKEVRKANPDGTTHFLRPMPGSARMYPETDIGLITPSLEGIHKPELLTDKAANYEKLGLAKDLARQMSRSDIAGDFERFAAGLRNIEPAYIATTMLTAEKQVKTRTGLDVRVSTQEYRLIFEQLNSGRLSKEAVFEVLVEKAKGHDFEEALRKYESLPDEELEKRIRRIAAENKGLSQSALIGKAMQQLRGKADGKKIAEIVKKLSG